MSNRDPLAPLTEGGQLTRWIAAQQSVVGSILIDERCCGEVFQATTAEMFSDSTLRHIYEAARKVWMEKQHVDPILVMDACGSDSYGDTMAACMKITPTAANVLEYCELCEKCLKLFNFRQAGYALLDAMTADDAEAVWQELGKQLMGGRRKNVYSYRDMMDSFFYRLNDPAPPDYIDWGFPPLNEVMTVQHGHFVVIGAESSTGKTLLAFQMARHLAECGKRVGFFSLETPHEDAEDRLMANGGNVALPAIKHKRVDDLAMKRLTQDAEHMYDVDFDLIEAAGYSVDDITRDTIANRYEVIFVDYVQLVNALNDNDISRQVRNVSIGLRTLSLQLRCTVIALSQVTPPEKDRNGKRRQLTKWDLRESKQLVNDAQAIMLLDLTDLNDYSSPRVMIVDKNKDGQCGKMFLEIDAPHMRFNYLPAYEDPAIADARERNEKMDRNRQARQEKELRKRGIEGQATFRELDPDEGGELPF